MKLKYSYTIISHIKIIYVFVFHSPLDHSHLFYNQLFTSISLPKIEDSFFTYFIFLDISHLYKRYACYKTFVCLLLLRFLFQGVSAKNLEGQRENYSSFHIVYFKQKISQSNEGLGHGVRRQYLRENGVEKIMDPCYLSCMRHPKGCWKLSA